MAEWVAEEAFVEERLGRACASAEWSKLHPRAKVTHLTASYSDYDPILLDTTSGSTPTPVDTPFCNLHLTSHGG